MLVIGNYIGKIKKTTKRSLTYEHLRIDPLALSNVAKISCIQRIKVQVLEPSILLKRSGKMG